MSTDITDSIAIFFSFLLLWKNCLYSHLRPNKLSMCTLKPQGPKGVTLQFSLLSHASSVSLTVLAYFCQHIHMLFIFHLKKNLLWAHISCELLFCVSAPFYGKIPLKCSFCYLHFFPFSLELTPVRLSYHRSLTELLSKSPVTSPLLNPAVSSVFIFFNMFVAFGTVDSFLLATFIHLVSL